MMTILFLCELSLEVKKINKNAFRNVTWLMVTIDLAYLLAFF